jgi:predicted ABC-type ATPase
MARRRRPFVFVLAGVNGAGKSSVGGNLLAEHGLTWFNPDAYARELMARLGLAPEAANAAAWQFGRKQLEEAISQHRNFAFETTLGGDTIPGLLVRASATHDVTVWFCGLASVEFHLQRVASRAALGGHDIPEAKIRERWVSSRRNLIALLPHLSHLQVHDNSAEAKLGRPIPEPRLLLEVVDGRLLTPDPGNRRQLAATPAWAVPLVEAAIGRRARS